MIRGVSGAAVAGLEDEDGGTAHEGSHEDGDDLFHIVFRVYTGRSA
jgi:hypothetical protein